jgi:hypothetical protein
MINKERLEIIKFLRNSEKTVAPGMQPSELISRKDVDWLINRVEELELEVSDWRAEVQKWQKFYKESEESHSETKELLYSTISENKRYKQALEFYAERDNYQWEVSYRPQQEIDCMVIDDSGHTARKALESDEN